MLQLLLQILLKMYIPLKSCLFIYLFGGAFNVASNDVKVVSSVSGSIVDLFVPSSFNEVVNS